MLIILGLIFLITPVFADEPGYYDEYESVSYIPEPMMFDLVRPLGSKKGQWEINTLITQEESPALSHSHVSPEIEYVFAENWAAEVEIPMIGGEPDSLKGVLQWTAGHSGKSRQIVHGFQLITQRFIDEDTHNELTPIYIYGHRFNHDYTMLAMIGDQYHYGEVSNGHFLVLNATIFHVYSRVKDIEFGLEQNVLGFGHNFQYWRITPQIDVVLEDHWKIQTGFGTLYTYVHGWESTSSLRVVKEFY